MPEHERGRDLVGTGRGGAGNAVRSPSRGRPVESAEEHKASTAYKEAQSNVHAGRGGAGNIRSPSRDPTDHAKAYEEERKEQQIQLDAIKKEQSQPHHAGRGGAGNIRSESKERSDDRGRGGVIGNALKSFSRSRSRDTNSKTPPNRIDHHPHGDSKLRPVDESSSTLNGSGEKEHKGLVEKLASHLPTSNKS